MSEPYDETAAVVDQIASDLAECRQRGVEWLDRNTQKQARVSAIGLQRLAQHYVGAKQLAVPGRIAQIKTLLRHALDELTRQGDDADARLIRDLFFGESTQTVTKSAGVLLDLARKNSGEPSEARFREWRTTAFRAFAGFLIQFVDRAQRESIVSPDPATFSDPENGTPPPEPVAHAAAAAGAEPDLLQVTTGYVGERGDRFIELLANAVNVTIVGFTHDQLTTALSESLALKRTRLGRPDAFWNSLRIVFLGDSLLDYVNDEREESPDRGEAVRERRRAMTWGRRSVRLFLRRTLSTRWFLFESPFLPPFAGTLFELPNRKHIVQLIIRRPFRATADNLYLEFEDLADEYLASAFEDVVRNSIADNKAVPIGIPSGQKFQCKGRRFRQNILRDGSAARMWLPMVLIVTTRQKGGQIEPMLQMRTEDNAVREINKLSHLSGHVFQEDHSRSYGASPVSVPLSFDITADCTIGAAQRRVQMETGDDAPPALRPVTTGSYQHPDKEHLFFFVYSLHLPDDFDFPSRSEMHQFPLPELLAIRANHALRVAEQLCQRTELPSRLWAAAAEIVSLNLALHDYAELGQKILDLADQPRAALNSTTDEIRRLIERTTATYASPGKEIQIMGLSGWQYREFFTVLMPLYADIGVPRAADQLNLLLNDECKCAARDRLAELYQDEDLMRLMPIEL